MNRKRVQMLRDMIAGIPEERLALHTFYEQDGPPCGTIACIAGWAAIYPPFIEQGFYKKQWEPFGFKAPSYGDEFGMDAAATFFGVKYYVFAARFTKEIGTEKEIALARLDRLLKARNDSAEATNK